MSRSELQAELNELRNLVEAQQIQLEALTSASAAQDVGEPTQPAEVPAAAPTETSRRNLLKKTLVGGAVGAVGLAAVARPVAAANGDTLKVGQTNTGTDSTVLDKTGASSDSALVVTSEGSAPAIEGSSPSGSGILGFSDDGMPSSDRRRPAVPSWPPATEVRRAFKRPARAASERSSAP